MKPVDSSKGLIERRRPPTSLGDKGMKWFGYFFGIFAAICVAFIAVLYLLRLVTIILNTSWTIIVPIAVVIFCAVIATIIYEGKP